MSSRRSGVSPSSTVRSGRSTPRPTARSPRSAASGPPPSPPAARRVPRTRPSSTRSPSHNAPAAARSPATVRGRAADNPSRCAACRGPPARPAHRRHCQPLDKSVKNHACLIPRRQQFVAVLAGVAGSAYPHVDATEFGVRVSHVIHVGRQAQTADDFGRFRSLHGEHRVRAVFVGDRQSRGCALRKRRDDGAGVRGVGHQEDLVVGDVVGDQVVDDSTGIGAAQRVLRLARVRCVEGRW